MPTDRCLHPAVGRLGCSDRDPDAEHSRPEVGRAARLDRPQLADDQDDRPVPEIEAVGALADPGEGTDLQGGASHARRRDDRQHEHGCGERGQRDPEAEGPRARLIANHEQREQHNRRPRSDRPTEPRPACRGGPRAVRCGIREGQSGTEHEPDEVGVGAVVDARGGRRVEESGHECRRSESHGQRDGHPDSWCVGEAQQREGGKGPEQIELLLDGERPQVHEELGRRCVEVVGAVSDLEPVRREGRCPQGLAADSDEQVGLDESGDQGRDEDAEREGREQAAGAASPEAGQVEPAVPPHLADQQRGDEEARDDEEDVDAEEAAGQPGRVEVEGDDGDDRQRAKTVEPREVGGGLG